MKFYADIEIHSKYARAVSSQMTLENLALWAKKKGLAVVSTGDFTHPDWFSDIVKKLEPAEPGLYQLKKEYSDNSQPFDQRQTRFILGSEISCIYSKAGRTRRVHHLVYAPSLEIAEQINTKLSWVGNLRSDGRPIIGIDSKELLKTLLSSSPDSVLIPAHVWTPWFGVFGSKSGFDSLQECFDELEPQIFAVESGLSSDPSMNWRIKFLDNKTIVSGSDSHSLPRLGREATIFNTELSYQGIMSAIKSRDERFVGTVEFFPEEGRYHYDGHATCGVCFSPEESKKNKNLCPKCKKPLVIGVMARVNELADPQRPEGFKPAWAKPFYRMVALDEVLSEALGVGKTSKAVWKEYEEIVSHFGPELYVLLDAPEDQLRRELQGPTAEAIIRMRQGKLNIRPGYDGEYGVIRIFEDGEAKKFVSQKALF
jgi:uncharacterized protein (TIGR00375 family)